MEDGDNDHHHEILSDISDDGWSSVGVTNELLIIKALILFPDAEGYC